MNLPRVSKKKGAFSGFIAGYLAGMFLSFFAMIFWNWEMNKVNLFLLPVPFGFITSIVGWYFPRTMAALAWLLAFIPIP
ncbi:hypothetical protein [Puniceicoccus vermicola]|uniref:Uncharacterized protein n=1 Tax=Puniceicoccus vermicola TaxID=388746 RepID=A0A7X1B042_9BACT|nr:hypothetical protein [Puniceicoccus vermicola]MBC2603151.1 hypothetical protein [Puniceicoccus vermicola]